MGRRVHRSSSVFMPEALVARNVVDEDLLKHREVHFLRRAVALWLQAVTNCSP